MQISLLQCQSGADVQANLAFIEALLALLPRVDLEPQLVVLPEACLLFGGHESKQKHIAKSAVESPLLGSLANLAKQYQVYLIAGTIPILAHDGRAYSRSYLFDDDGEELGCYDKLHLFDVEVSDGTKTYRESDTFYPGNKISVVDTPFGKIGLAICYDLRFPELFRAMRLAGAELIALPSAFTKVTGEAHWQTLLQARAIETQCFMLAANQWGANDGGRETWGQSMIVDPWGRILAQKKTGCGWVQAPLDKTKLNDIRQQIPVAIHNRFAKPTLIEQS
ncbi:carbon-nitrogen hydrolase family protein [Shewanella surugensis]|uniref:Carbon-nitrogen hydrolase family protein n=1 Tax=Shewanella surugensis TaxID=212020 RepID=A0ABT0LEL3_9GAMM|nr:carbon-nitrogen hydrolase family protein [Shewanella surugensis]MCL1126118.1 carbon-nitrogen hydrolase family protein [Shewanella surugensis]